MDKVLVCFYKYFQYYSDCCPVGKDGRTWPEVQCLMGNQITYMFDAVCYQTHFTSRELFFSLTYACLCTVFVVSVSQNKWVENGEKARVRQFRTSSVTSVRLFMFGFCLLEKCWSQKQNFTESIFTFDYHTLLNCHRVYMYTLRMVLPVPWGDSNVNMSGMLIVSF